MPFADSEWDGFELAVVWFLVGPYVAVFLAAFTLRAGLDRGNMAPALTCVLGTLSGCASLALFVFPASFFSMTRLVARLALAVTALGLVVCFCRRTTAPGASLTTDKADEGRLHPEG